MDATNPTNTLSLGLYSNATQRAFIGGPHTIYSEVYMGVMDELRIWNVARTQAQLQEFMNCTLKGTEQGLGKTALFLDL